MILHDLDTLNCLVLKTKEYREPNVTCDRNLTEKEPNVMPVKTTCIYKLL